MSKRELAIHYKKAYATTACGYYVGESQMTTDPEKVTCGICLRSRAIRYETVKAE